MGKCDAVQRCRALAALGAGALAVLISLLASATPAHATFPGQNGRIAFAKMVGSDYEIFTINPDGSGEVQLTNNAAHDSAPAWSPDGRWIAFESNRDGNDEIYVMASGGASQTRITNDPATDQEPAWSPGGQQIVFSSNRDGNSEVYKMDADGTGVVRLTTDSRGDSEPEWSHDGSKIAWTKDGSSLGSESQGSCVYTMNPDGSGQTLVTEEECLPEGFCGWYGWARGPTWFPNRLALGWSLECYDGNSEAYSYFVYFDDRRYRYDSGTRPNGPGVHSPDGNRGVFPLYIEPDCCPSYPSELYLANLTSPVTANPIYEGAVFNPDWQPVNPGYARPKGAAPATVRLVPAFEPCSSPNALHGPPLAVPACSPPVQESDYLTVGGAEGQPTEANFHGFVDFKLLLGDSATFADEADMRVIVGIDDVRRKADHLDYEGELQVSLPLRITDRWNGPSMNQAGTAQDAPLSFAVPCTATPDMTVGSTCSIATTVDAVAPGMVREGIRSSWGLGQVQVYDGGADGDAETADNTLFAVQGLFVP